MNGFKFTKVEEIRATGAFFAFIEQDGKVVGEVRDDGRGGEPLHHFNTRQAEADYEAAAAALLPGADAWMLSNYLLSAASVNRKRNVVAIKSLDEFVNEGVYYDIKGATSADQMRQMAKGKDLLCWDKKQYAFV